MMKRIAFVPARSGSKRLKNKNVKELNGFPLVCWTLKAFLDSNLFDSVVFSSDSLDYWNIVQEYIQDLRLTFHQRSFSEAGDKIKLFDYVQTHYHEWCDKNDLLSIGLPTAPLRSAEHIAEAMSLFDKHQQNIFSASEYDFPVSFAFTTSKISAGEKGSHYWFPLQDVSPMITGNTRSQDQPTWYHPNGAIYIIKNPGALVNVKSFYTDSLPYIMPRIFSLDVDTPEDFDFAELLMKRQVS